MTAVPGTSEAQRQQALLQAIFHRRDLPGLQPWLAGQGAARGLAAYRANVQAGAERALAAAFPTVSQLVGEAAFAAMARAYLHAQPPERGDLACFGAELPAFVAAQAALAEEPYLADVARLDWAVHQAERAADADSEAIALERLGDTDPAALRLHFVPGAAWLRSAHPVATIWHAHHGASDHREEDADRFTAVRAAFASGEGETAWVWRSGWRAQVAVLSGPEAVFNQAVLAGDDLAACLQAALDTDPAFDFAAWLTRALQEAWLSQLTVTDLETP